MNDLNTHYRQLLGLSADWDVVEVDLDLSANRVTIDLQHAGGKLCCPECAQACSRADTAHDLMASAVQRGLERRETDTVKHVGIDEKSFGSSHSYISVLTDTDQSRVLEVARDRTIAACEELWKTLTKPQLEQIESVSMDMWQAFMSSATKHVPNEKIVHDKFHIAKYLGEALDKVRRAEHRKLKQERESPLTGLHQLFCTTKKTLMEMGRTRF
jgi:transposase